MLLLAILYNPVAALSSASSGVSLFLGSVMPALLPAMILTNVMRRAGFFEAISNKMNSIMYHWLRCPGEGAGVVLTSLLCGTPTGSKAIGALYADGIIDKGQATRLATATTTVSPAFILGVAGISAGGGYTGLLLLTAHIIGTLVNSLLYRRYNNSTCENRKKRQNAINVLDAIIGGISDGASAIWIVGAAIILCAAITGVLSAMLPSTSIWLNCIMEMTLGTKKVAMLPINHEARILLIQAVLSFGGLSIWAQAISVTGGAVDMRVFAISKITHTAISTGLCGLFMPIIQIGKTELAFTQYEWLNTHTVQQIMVGFAVCLGIAAVITLIKKPRN